MRSHVCIAAKRVPSVLLDMVTIGFRLIYDGQWMQVPKLTGSQSRTC